MGQSYYPISSPSMSLGHTCLSSSAEMVPTVQIPIIVTFAIWELQKLSLRCSGGQAPITESLTLHKLHTLSIVEADDNACADRLNHLELPSLSTLEVHPYYQSSTTINILVSLIQRSGCQLTALNLWPMTYDGHLVLLLRVIPTLRELRTSGYLFDDDVVTQMVYRPAQSLPPLLPVLECLRLDELTCKRKHLVKMVESRCGSSDGLSDSRVNRVKTLEFVDYVELDPRLQARLDQCAGPLEFRNGLEGDTRRLS